MEHFEENLKQKKEKNIYLLQLTPPRIVIVSSALVGLLIFSFILGMTFKKSDNPQDLENLISKDHSKVLDVLDREIPPLPLEGDLSSNLSGGEDLDLELLKKEQNAKSKDVLLSEKKREVTIKSDKKINTTKKVSSKKVSKKKVVKKTKNLKYKVASKKKIKDSKVKKKDSKVVATSFSSSSIKSKKSPYLIQIASFTTRDKALEEVKSLKQKKYGAFVDKSLVKGKNFYRVRIGSFESYQKALSSLKNLKAKTSYKNSYIIKKTN